MHHEIDYLKDKIHEKSGWIFKEHTYTRDELLKSKHASKIYSMTGKIGDDAQNWYKRGELTEEGKAAYENEKEIVEDRFHQVKRDISRREPTFWESVKEGFDQFIEIVMNSMPELTRTLLDNVLNKYLPSPVKKLLSLPSLIKANV